MNEETNLEKPKMNNFLVISKIIVDVGGDPISELIKQTWASEDCVENNYEREIQSSPSKLELIKQTWASEDCVENNYEREIQSSPSKLRGFDLDRGRSTGVHRPCTLSESLFRCLSEQRPIPDVAISHSPRTRSSVANIM
ncbi:hypothetical protein QE152_g24600 [Popillia japonica]|uniref:Uncharacterized protein n=1 Tax=Popillia japonica TaxID=7064 RepID=A0AAW1K4K3_POPJA